MAKTYVALYYTYRDQLVALSDAERGQLLIALLDYAKDGYVPVFEGALQMAFLFIKSQIDRDSARYDERCRKNRNNALKRWEGNDAVAHNRIQTDAEHTEEDENAQPETNTPSLITYGRYNRVHMTQQEYDALVTEYGEREVARAIDYVDESAQINGNRNGWSDWAVVVWRCIRDGWGQEDADAPYIRQLIN